MLKEGESQEGYIKDLEAEEQERGSLGVAAPSAQCPAAGGKQVQSEMP